MTEGWTGGSELLVKCQEKMGGVNVVESEQTRRAETFCCNADVPQVRVERGERERRMVQDGQD